MIIKCIETAAELEFSERKGLSQPNGAEYFRATIRSRNLLASSQIYAFDPFDSSLKKFFEDLAESWEGWEGEKEWSSLEGELRLVCISDSLGHIAIEVILFNDWKVQNVFNINAGELEGIALNLKKFFAS